MLTRLLCGVVISSVFFAGLEECAAKKTPAGLSGVFKQKKAAGEGKKQEQKSLNEQKNADISNNFGFTSLGSNYSSTFSRSAHSWKEFRKTKKKDAMYPDMRRNLEESCKMQISELVSALRSEGFITEVTPEPIKDSQKEATRKSVYIALKDLSKTLEKHNGEFIKMINEQAKKYGRGGTEVMDPSVVEKLKGDEVFTTKVGKLKQKAGNDVTKRIVALCKLLKITTPEAASAPTASANAEMTPPPVPPKPDHKLGTKKADTSTESVPPPPPLILNSDSAKTEMTPPPVPPKPNHKLGTKKADTSTESVPPPPPLILNSDTVGVAGPTASNSKGLLGDIEKGDFKLRKVDPSAPRPAVKAGKPDETEMLRQVMAQRRADLKNDDDDDTEEEDPWED